MKLSNKNRRFQRRDCLRRLAEFYYNSILDLLYNEIVIKLTRMDEYNLYVIIQEVNKWD